MKKNSILFLILALIATLFADAQTPGVWTLKSGNASLNDTGVYGTIGVPAVGVRPPSLYEASEWTDLQGNFWLYSGFSGTQTNDMLWQYNPGSGMWTWVKGSHTAPTAPVYGTKGVPSVDNSPGWRVTSCTWVDSHGDLWLYGGGAWVPAASGGAPFADLWRYNIATNSWTWMKGDRGEASYYPHYGVKDVEDTVSRPGSALENAITWTGANNDLWMLDIYGCLWRYNITTNNWTWKKGNHVDTITWTTYPVYGIKGVAAMSNTPGFAGMCGYTRWKDHHGNLWYLDGQKMVLWKYDPTNNMWTWVNGDTATLTSHYGTANCIDNDHTIMPLDRKETRACWIDACDNLWMMGGFSYSNNNLSDLMYYDILKDSWVWAGEGSSGRSGALPFTDQSGNLWYYGGIVQPSQEYHCDLWVYKIDTACTKCTHPYTEVEGIKPAALSIYPNPCYNELTIDGGGTIIQNVEIINFLGQLVYSKQHNAKQAQIDTRSLPSGIYLAKINEGEVRRFVKQ